LLALAVWFSHGPTLALRLRVPGTDQAPGTDSTSGRNPVLAGQVTRGEGQPADLPGAWPGFRGAARDNISADAKGLARSWGSGGPRELWAVDLGEGYAGAAVRNGRVYLLDYDQTKKQDALRCLSLADGREIWRFAYPISVKRNHGMSRTVPAVTDQHAVSLGPKCHVACVDAVSGELKWGLDLVRQFGSKVPQWYAGQCPLIESNRVILAPAGTNALLLAIDLATGNTLWQSPNPNEWNMTHSSVAPMDFAGRHSYVYCADKGVVGIAADSGALLWQTTDWKITIATVPSPLPLPEGRLFLSGGYDAGSLMLQLAEQEGKITAKTLFRLEPSVFGAAQQTPIFHQGNIYGVRPDGRFTCLDLNGKVVWTSEANQQFGMGPFLLADGLFFVMNDAGKLSLLEASPSRCTLLAQAQVLKGHDSWGPMAFAAERLLVRDLTRLACLQVK
jgi:outer membrane protein assembly factor BamB